MCSCRGPFAVGARFSGSRDDSRRGGRCRQGRAAPEHLQHPSGDYITADDVRRGERCCQEGDHVAHGVVGGDRDQHGSREHDAVDGVRRGHQRRMQGRGHLTDDLEAHPQGEYEDGDVNEQRRVGHGWPPSLAWAPGDCWRADTWSGGPGGAAAVGCGAPSAGWTMAPPDVITTPACSSSFRSSASSPSLIKYSSSAVMLRAYMAEAAGAMLEGKPDAPMIVTPCSVTTV